MGGKLRFRILMTLLPITVILLITNSLYHYNIMKQKMLVYYDDTRQDVEAHILDIVNLIDSGYRMLEIRLESDLQEKAEAFLELYTSAEGNLDRIDLNQLKLEQGSSYDFMVIDPSTAIIKSTINEALKFNFSDFDPKLGVKINAVRNGSEIWFEQVRTNVGTGKLSKFAYMPTSDQKYLLEVAYSVDGFDAVSEELRPNSIIERMIEISPMIVDIRMFDVYGYQIVDSGINYEPTEASLEIIKRAKTEKNYEIVGPDNLRKKYLYIDLNQNRERTMADTDRVIEIIFDETLLESQLSEMWQTTVLGIVVVLVFLVFSIFYFSKQLTKPIEALKEVSKQITQGNYDVKVDIDSTDEVGELAQSFNLMVQEINHSFLKIENQKLALEDYNKNLENMVGQRTSELKERNLELESKNNELEIAWIKANEATESKSSFLAMISHEIRTPINGIIGMTYLMLKTRLSEKQNDYTQKIRGLAENLLEIINDVLDVSKLEAGKVSLENKLFRLEEIFELLSNQFGYKCSEKGLEFILNNDINMPSSMIGDSLRVRQILTNLINNAIKFTEKGEIIVSTSVLELTETYVKVQFEIRDTGIGIASQKLEKLFEPFQQADDTIARKYGGTGLGLSICKRFVALMSGEIWVESEINQGSTFYFTATFELGDDDLENTEALEDTFKDLNVLIVDDSEATRDHLYDLLSEYSKEVQMAASGEDAIQMVQANRNKNSAYNLILIDWKMSGLNGIETAYEIKRLPYVDKAPAILMITGYDLDEIKKADKSLYIDAFLSKPIIKHSLLQIMNQILNNNKNTHYPVRHNVTKRIETEESVRILLVEDNQINQQIIVALLEHPLIYVDVVTNGVAAISAIDQYNYDLVLMDIQMPDLDGIEATKRIRERKSKERLPIVAMTAHAMEEDRIKCYEAGMNDYMSKPIEEGIFFDIITKWIHKKINIVEVETELYYEQNDISGKLHSLQTKAPIAALHGNWQLYVELLESFYQKYHGIEFKLLKLIDESDFNAIKSIIHAIRGVSGNLGAMDLFIVSQSLETDLSKKTIDRDNNSLETFIKEFKRVMSDIEGLEEIQLNKLDETFDHTSHLESPLEFDELVEIVKKYLKEGSSDSELYVTALGEAMEQRNQSELGQILIEQIKNYDFYEALTTLEEIEAKFNDH